MFLKYEIQREDYVQASRALTVQKRQPWIPRFLPVTICALGVLILAKGDGAPPVLAPSLLIIFGAIFAIHRIAAAHDALDRAWQDATPFLRPISLEASVDGLKFSTVDYQSSYGWSAVRSFRETRDLFILCRSPSQALHYVPKRCFQSLEQMNEFRSLLLEKVGPVPKSTGGFPVIIKSSESEKTGV